MSYRIEGKDIVISGFEEGIADSPYAGIADMRNVEIVSVTGEASVGLSQVAASAPPVMNNVAYTYSASTDRMTIASVTGLYEGCAISVTPTAIFDFDSLVIGGGGGGGGATGPGSPNFDVGGGGGAGGFKATTHTNVAGGAYTVTIGAGGAGGAVGAQGTDGGTTSIGAIATVAGGGGGGGDGTRNGKAGASGGGAARAGTSAGTGGAGTALIGNNGGDSSTTISTVAAGGGGATAVGNNGGAGGSPVGDGGAGTASSISGASVTYAGGGGGGGGSAVGGAGGGGNGGATAGSSGSSGTAGTANTGGGGGGAMAIDDDYAGSAGGSGVAIISYPTGSFGATGGTITTSGGNTIHTFTTSGTFTISDLSANTVYYVRNISGNTFQLSLAPQGAIIDITSDVSGTLTTYQYGNQRGFGDTAPVARTANSYQSGPNGIYLTDSSNYAWCILSAVNSNLPANSLIFLGNIGGVGASSTILTGISTWLGYLFIIGSSGVGTDVANIDTLFSDGPVAAWDYTWQLTMVGSGINRRCATLVSQEDNNLYWTSPFGLGSLIQQPGETFDPADSNTYEMTVTAVQTPNLDKTTCLAELGSNIVIGGLGSFIYVWDKIAPNFNTILNIPDSMTTNIIATSNNAYVFSGVRGNIYVTNGSGIDLYKKLPDYLVGIVNPYITWRDADYSRNQIYFTFTAQSNADAAQTTIAGAWAIDLGEDALRMLNKLTSSGYGGTSTMVVARPFPNATTGPSSAPFFTDNPAGTGVMVGWYSGSTYGIDVGSSDPYTGYESYIQTDMIPIGTFLKPFTGSQIEWKTSVPLVSGEAVKIEYRTNLSASFTQIGESTTAGAISDLYKVNFQKVQWLQLQISTKSTASSPSFVRLTEVRIRDYPSV